MAYEIKYRSDNEMKDSGIEWLGKIPKEWEILPVKRIFKLKRDKSFDKEPKILSLTQKGIIERDISNNEGQIAASYEGYVKVEVGDFVLNPMDLVSGYVDKSRYEGVISPAYITFTNIDNRINLDFYKFYFQMLYHHKYLFPFGEGVSFVHRWTLKNEIFLNYPILKNEKINQQKIANFLDIKTAEFDSIISKKQQLIEKLEEAKKSLISEVVTGKVKIVDGELVDRKPEEMKDSGVEWLGMIPRDWEVKKLKHLAVLNGRIGFRGYSKEDLVDEPEGALTIGATQVDENGNIDLTDPVYISWKKYYESPEIIIKQYDILLVQRGSTTGKIGIVNILPKEATINPSLIIIRSVQNIIHPKYLFYFLISYYTDAYFNSIISTTAIPMISQYQAMNTNILLPSLLHQKTIIQYLDNASNKIDSTITKTKQQITKLKEAKQSLISEAVTGKIDLRDWEII